MRITTYGEDGLTLWALANRLESILRAVGDATDAADAVVLFRPSFGRRAPSQRRTDRSPLRESQFGEFDAIVGTKQNALALEFKREGCSEYRKRDGRWVIELRREQYRRHEVFDWYLQQYSDYVSAGGQGIQKRFIPHLSSEGHQPMLRSPGNAPALPPGGSTLAKNLECILGRVLSNRPLEGRQVQHIVVYMYDAVRPDSAVKVVKKPDKRNCGPEHANPDAAGLEFKVVCLPVHDGLDNGFVDLEVRGVANGSH